MRITRSVSGNYVRMDIDEKSCHKVSALFAKAISNSEDRSEARWQNNAYAPRAIIDFAAPPISPGRVDGTYGACVLFDLFGSYSLRTLSDCAEPPKFGIVPLTRLDSKSIGDVVGEQSPS